MLKLKQLPTDAKLLAGAGGSAVVSASSVFEDCAVSPILNGDGEADKITELLLYYSF